MRGMRNGGGERGWKEGEQRRGKGKKGRQEGHGEERRVKVEAEGGREGHKEKGELCESSDVVREEDQRSAWG